MKTLRGVFDSWCRNFLSLDLPCFTNYLSWCEYQNSTNIDFRSNCWMHMRQSGSNDLLFHPFLTIHQSLALIKSFNFQSFLHSVTFFETKGWRNGCALHFLFEWKSWTIPTALLSSGGCLRACAWRQRPTDTQLAAMLLVSSLCNTRSKKYIYICLEIILNWQLQYDQSAGLVPGAECCSRPD